MKRGWEGAVLKLLRSKDFVLTVTGTEVVNDRFRRIHVTDGGMLAVTGVHPTMWVRLWFSKAGKPHQRGYTLVDPDPDKGTFSLEFVLHEGPASDWARAAREGDTVEATVHGSDFTTPDPPPSHLYVVGDAASLPAINSLLDELGEVPATVWYETSHPLDARLPMRLDPARHDLRTVARGGGGLMEEVRSTLPDLLGKHRDTDDYFVWVACDTVTTRSLTAYLRKELSVPRPRVKALGYWRPD
ncbi:SIP domain-containing protein [Streptomyces sp. SID4919]|uniref:siderophore-interacting protein n=1 Tax=unclassified Streptomyces TaxID=2593676 RepID=UPI000823BEE0|nr:MULTISPECIES: siderophore-interacting protein [unclassified Streptomyces]MYY12619.1 SIP domain-containing protein [Streptomyces sp. SID4919]SCK19770.1 NADPH-dependent ferric siderophore reductase, contains FAD-binding and SIP domains [Streptomyces sp. AmelKG-E11A]